MDSKPSITELAEVHTKSYIRTLLSPDLTAPVRAAKMATHYHLPLTSFIDGSITSISDAALWTSLIQNTLEKLEKEEGSLEVKSIRSRL